MTGAALTLTDDETLPTVALVLSSSSITETGGVSTVTATLSRPVERGGDGDGGGGRGNRGGGGGLRLEHDDDPDHRRGGDDERGPGDGDREWQRRGCAQQVGDHLGHGGGGNGAANPPDVTLTLEDDETLPTVALVLTPSSISESGGVSTVTATLSGASSEAVTVTVAAAAGTGRWRRTSP